MALKLGIAIQQLQRTRYYMRPTTNLSNMSMCNLKSDWWQTESKIRYICFRNIARTYL